MAGLLKRSSFFPSSLILPPGKEENWGLLEGRVFVDIESRQPLG